jgi:uncharacterized protein (TIGR02246 family)
MTKRRRFGLALCLVGAAALGVVGKLASRADEGKEAPKSKRAQQFIEAFDKGDAKAVAGFWTADGDYIDPSGRQFKGREAIEKLYAKAFDESKGAKLSITLDSQREVTPDVAIHEGVSEVTPPDGGPPALGRFTAVLVKKDGEWYFEHVRESTFTPPANSQHLEGIAWIVGDWEGTGEKGAVETVSNSWDDNENFIVASFATLLKGVPVAGGTQWIGYDAVDKTVRSWSFYSNGGFGEAVWTQDGNKWSIKAKAHTGDGKKVEVTNVLTKVDDDNATWQRTHLTVDGKEQPDGPVVKLKRVKDNGKKE